MSQLIENHRTWVSNTLDNYLEHQEYYTEDKEPVPTFLVQSIQALSYAQSLLSTLSQENIESSYLSSLAQNSSLMSKQITARFIGKEMIMNAQEVSVLCSPAYSPYGWSDLIQDFLDDSVQREVMNGLIQDLEISPYFRHPVTLGISDDSDGRKPMSVIDGTHRFCSYLMKNYEQIPVQLMYCSLRRHEPIHSTMITHITHNSTDSIDDDVMKYLMSVRINDNFWVSADVVSGCPQANSGEISYMEFVWDDFRSDKVSHELLSQTILHKLNNYKNLNWEVKTFVETYE